VTKHEKTKKTEKEDFLTKNHNHAIKYRKRVQEEFEAEQELQQFLKEQDASTEIQDNVRREHLPK
jgi:hypothetical protein